MISNIRGIRNNNPANIERGSDQWQGMSSDQSSDARFIVFESPEYGVRAMVKILSTYKNRGVETMGDIIAAWAPPVENDTASYIQSVENQTGIAAGDVINHDNMPEFIAAVILHENGFNPYSESLIEKGISLA